MHADVLINPLYDGDAVKMILCGLCEHDVYKPFFSFGEWRCASGFLDVNGTLTLGISKGAQTSHAPKLAVQA